MTIRETFNPQVDYRYPFIQKNNNNLILTELTSTQITLYAGFTFIETTF